MENEMAECSANSDGKQLKRLTLSYDALQKELAAAEQALEAVIAQL